MLLLSWVSISNLFIVGCTCSDLPEQGLECWRMALGQILHGHPGQLCLVCLFVLRMFIALRLSLGRRSPRKGFFNAFDLIGCFNNSLYFSLLLTMLVQSSLNVLPKCSSIDFLTVLSFKIALALVSFAMVLKAFKRLW